MSNEKVSGFDMTATLLWYFANLDTVMRNLPVNWARIRGVRIPTPCFDATINEDGLPAEEQDATSFVGVAQLLPPSSLARSHLRDVIIRPPQWFHRDSTGEKPISTQSVEEALSPGAIIPSFIRYRNWDEGECQNPHFPYAAVIEMYEMPGTGLPPELLDPMGKLRPALRRLVWDQAVLHEMGHTIVTPAFFGGSGKHTLRLPDGREVDQYHFLMEAAPIVRELTPISHYASAYSNPDGSLKEDRRGTVHTALGEHLAEAIVAYLLEFAYQPDGHGLDPFYGREPLRQFIEAFLHAEWVA